MSSETEGGRQQPTLCLNPLGSGRHHQVSGNDRDTRSTTRENEASRSASQIDRGSVHSTHEREILGTKCDACHVTYEGDAGTDADHIGHVRNEARVFPTGL